MSFINQRTRNLQQGAIRAMFDRANQMTGVISMGIGEPDMATPKSVRDAGKKALEQGLTHYTPNAGTMALREAVAERSSLREIGYDPAKEIIITNGGMGALSLLMAVILDPGDEVLIQDPQWLNYAAQVTYYGGVPVRVPTDAAHGFEMQPEDIERLITPRTKALIINTPNNPTGHVIGQETLKKIAEIACRRDILVISDEVYNTLLYDGAEGMSIAALPSMKRRTVVVNSFSKAYAMTGWRIGYAAGPEEIVDKMTKCQENFNACANAIGQYAAVYALSHPAEAETLRRVFQERREITLRGLEAIPGLVCDRPKGAFYVFPSIQKFGVNDSTFCNRLLVEQKVVCIPGSAFGTCGKGHIRIAYTTDQDSLKEALRRLSQFCAQLSHDSPEATR